eukprot:TRINITY_DN9684_c0_g1_i1.p1 TRINITY_DN9684_c0_g1~~TRINITY_DN9684_c0_g1_i1.p1  ORF type:complete len:100 (+),score=11.26 TRINITY_DN9684_c0_g1_i1:998-1297(+)
MHKKQVISYDMKQSFVWDQVVDVFSPMVVIHSSICFHLLMHKLLIHDRFICLRGHTVAYPGTRIWGLKPPPYLENFKEPPGNHDNTPSHNISLTLSPHK